MEKSKLAQEIRINNLLQYKEGKDVAIVEFVSNKHFDCRTKSGFFTPNGEYEPIELTEDWLKKFGFEEKQIRTDLKNKLGDYAYSLNSVPFFTVIQDNDGFILSKFETYLITVKNVHQLQNLFFLLVGEELKIKQ